MNRGGIMTEMQVKMAEAMERERTNKANEAIKERENTAKYGWDYKPYDNLSNWNVHFQKYNKLGEGFPDSISKLAGQVSEFTNRLGRLFGNPIKAGIK